MIERKVWRSFASDNYAGVHPEILEAMASVNEGHERAYGADAVTDELSRIAKIEFGDHATIYPVFNGTGANVVSLSAATRRWEAVICAYTAHINTDEGGAPEKMAGLKLWTIQTPNGKLTPELIETQCFDFEFVHRAQQAVVSITQTTEMGTLYSIDEIRAIAETAHKHGLYLHMDGARLSNAAAALGATFKQFTTDVGVDLVSFGGTKIGALAAEAVVVLNPKLDDQIPYLRKTSMQLPSKMRFVSAQLIALLRNGSRLAIANGNHANGMARKLDAGIRELGLALPNPTEANAVFPILPAGVFEKLQSEFPFYIWDHTINQVRLMCSWDTTEADVDALLAAIKREIN